MVLEERITLMSHLGQYFLENSEELNQAIYRAESQNPWFTHEHISYALKNIAEGYLEKDQLEKWTLPFPVFQEESNDSPTVGLVMAGNIPLVGFHDFLAVFISGCRQRIKLSTKDTILWQFILEKLISLNPKIKSLIKFEDRLNGCDAYIATGSGNTAKYFKYYFQKYPNIIRSNKTSVAVLNGHESGEDLELLAEDICSFFGFGCRNVTKIFVPKDYNFEPLIKALNKFGDQINHYKYKNNYDFQLAMYLLNKVEYMSSDSVLIVPSDSVFSPISVLNYEFYDDEEIVIHTILNNEDVQCTITAIEDIQDRPRIFNFGEAQKPGLTDYADGISTLDFLAALRSKKTND